MKLTPIRKCGSFAQWRLSSSYAAIVAALGKPNVTDLDDPWKVKASWGVEDEQGRQLFVWCYKTLDAETCTRWSVDGDRDLFNEVFGDTWRN